MVHELKIKSGYLVDIKRGSKNFEVREDDRNFKSGDYLHLRGYHNGEYTGDETVVQITYKFSGNDEYGLKKGFCVLGIVGFN